MNRGIGKPVEFKGLKSQYLFIFAGGLLAVFVVFIILFMAGVNQWVCIGFIVSASLLLVWQTFRLNARYGTYGLMKIAARKRADLPAQCPVRHIRADEDSRPQTASTFHYQPQGDTQIIHL